MNIGDEHLDSLAAKLAPLVARQLAHLIEERQSQPEQLLDVEGLATRLDVSVRTIRRLDATGKIPQAIRVGRAMRWLPHEITAWQTAGMPDRSRWEATKAARGRKPLNLGGHTS